MGSKLPADADPWIDTEEIGFLCGGLSRDWVRRKATDGAFGGIRRDGRRIYARYSGVQAYLRQTEVTRRVKRQVREETARTERTALDRIHQLRREEGPGWAEKRIRICERRTG